ncbi:MAG: Fic family protein, partial [Deltaproteobacteria bacterium]|nr:Fic family protein [Deltaproteobacteria bacterium]
MSGEGRYSTSGMLEGQFEPGSNGQVLKNLLGINNCAELERIETECLYDLTDQLLDECDQNKRFTADDILQMHRRWLGTVYVWAGRYRQVMMTKDGFPFAAPAHISKLMADFENDILSRYTPCSFTLLSEVLSALAIVHSELILIHPFREGNGRLARLLATLMALQAGLPPLNFSDFDGIRREEYFLAIRKAMDRDYEPMEIVFNDV